MNNDANTYKVLLVDDEEELVSTLVERLGYRNFAAEYALNATTALDMLRKTAYDVVVVDLKLPGISGNELVQIIRKAYPNIPVILMTGHGNDKFHDSAAPEDVSSLIQKPFDVSQLVTMMKKAIAEHEH